MSDPNNTPGSTPVSSRHPEKLSVLAIAVVATFIVTTILSVLTMSALGFSRDNDSSARDRIAMTFQNTPENREALDKLKFYMEVIKSDFYRELSDAELLEKMIEGLPSALGDPYTYYLTPEDVQAQADAMRGEYSGIGVIVNFTDRGEIVITEVLIGSPAEQGGMLAGDSITHVDGIEVESFSSREELANAVRGPIGTEVEVGLYRPDTDAQQTVSVTRAKITNASLNYRMQEDGIGYIHIKEFSFGVADEFTEAVETLTDNGAQHFVLDLRFNTGGNADEVLAMLNFLLPEGRIAEIRGRSDGEEVVYTWDSESDVGVPDQTRYAVLINEFSASASELFAGCLHDYQKATLIGEQTFGKGTGTTTFKYKDGSAVNLSIFRYYLPLSGVSVEGDGLAPDIAITLPDEYRYIAVNLVPEDEDTQLQEGLNVLREIR